ncbi:MAG TPA: ATP-grasp ribosomal peptide maturase [Micromonosporaceae bacterium]|nr:ATP-grasp ribosomal peptide maturase [Micromonosporaceae bacterium]
MTPTVLILSHPDDAHVGAVRAHLDRAGARALVLDTADLGTGRGTVTARVRGGTLAGDIAGCDLGDVGCVWHRRPSEFTAGDADDAAELRSGIGGVLAGLPHLNHPADMAVAGFKPYQLDVAARCGLAVPDTIITTDATRAAEMASAYGGAVVVKPMSRRVGGLVRDGDRAGWSRVIHLTQKRIAAVAHVRLTMVDGTPYAAEITSPHLDWRTDLSRCAYRVVETPDGVAEATCRLLAALRLRFGVMDFAVDGDRRWWFLELNPNGQWLWIEHVTGLPIAAAIASALRSPPVAGTGRRRAA